MIHVAKVFAADAERLAGWSACDQRCSSIARPVDGPDIGKLHRPMRDVLDLPAFVMEDGLNGVAIPLHEQLVDEPCPREAKAEATATREKLDTLHVLSLSATAPYHKLRLINTVPDRNDGVTLVLRMFKLMKLPVPLDCSELAAFRRR